MRICTEESKRTKANPVCYYYCMFGQETMVILGIVLFVCLMLPFLWGLLKRDAPTSRTEALLGMGPANQMLLIFTMVAVIIFGFVMYRDYRNGSNIINYQQCVEFRYKTMVTPDICELPDGNQFSRQ